VSDPLGVTARALPPVEVSAGRGRSAAAAIGKIAALHGVVEIVVGLPRNMDGTEGPSATGARRVAADLEAYCPGIKVILHDERLTTALAERALIEADLSRAKRRRLIDGQAAVVLLTSYLSQTKGNTDCGPRDRSE